MLKDVKVRLKNKPGTLADLGEALGKDDVNIEGLCGPCEREGIARILVNDVVSARSVLTKAGIEVIEESDVLVLAARALSFLLNLFHLNVTSRASVVLR